MNRLARQIGMLAAALVLTGLCLALPAWFRFGAVGLEGLAAAIFACLLPGVLLAVAARYVSGGDRPLQLLLIGMGLRVGLVLAMGWTVVESRPQLRSSEFFIGLALLYFVALAVETRLLLESTSGESRTSETPESGPAVKVVPGSSRQPQSH